MAVTIKDVARAAQTSTATASKVMNGSYSISEETAMRVKKAMEELHYLPNQRARNFASQSTKTVIFVTSLGMNTGFSNPHMFEIMCGLENTLTDKGYSLIVKSVQPQKVCEFIRQAYEMQQADGFVIHASVLSKELDGVLSILNEHDVILPKGYVLHGESECDAAYRMMESILAMENQPDAIICANNYIAYGCVTALHDHHIPIPEKMAVITFDDFPFSQILKPRLTVVNIDVFGMGVQAGKYVIQKIRKNNLYLQSYITLPSIIEREST